MPKQIGRYYVEGSPEGLRFFYDKRTAENWARNQALDHKVRTTVWDTMAATKDRGAPYASWDGTKQ
jgi:hypothetical protein